HLDDIVESMQCFFNRGGGIESMDLIKVDVIRAEPAQAVVDRMHDVLAGQSAVIRVVTHRHINFGGNDEPVAARCKILQRAAENLLALAYGVHIGGIEVIDAHIERFLDEWPSLFLVENPRPPLFRSIGHGAQAQARYFQSSPSK